MGLIDIFNIETYSGSSSGWITTLITAIGSISGVAIGFYLKYLYDKKDEERKRLFVGETFENQLKLYEGLIKKQIVAINAYRLQVLGGGKTSPINAVSKRIKEIDLAERTELIRYFIRKKRTDAVEYVNNSSSFLDIVLEETKEFIKISSQYPDSINAYLIRYREELNKIQNIATTYKRGLQQGQYNDELELQEYDKLITEHFKDVKINLNLLMGYRDSLHKIFSQPKFTFSGIQFYDKLHDWNFNAITLIIDMEGVREGHLYHLDIIEKNLKFAYKKIYMKELDLSDISIN